MIGTSYAILQIGTDQAYTIQFLRFFKIASTYDNIIIVLKFQKSVMIFMFNIAATTSAKLIYL